MAEYSRDELEAKTVADLKTILQNQGMKVAGKKAALIDRILKIDRVLNPRQEAILKFILYHFSDHDFERSKSCEHDHIPNRSPSFRCETYGDFVAWQTEEVAILTEKNFSFVEEIVRRTTKGGVSHVDKERMMIVSCDGFILKRGALIFTSAR